MPPKSAEDYFNFLAKIGLTKHYGSLDATRELVELTGLEAGQRVIDLGCGAGATPVNLAQELGTTVYGSDLVEAMLHRSQERAAALQVLDLTPFVAADARALQPHLSIPDQQQAHAPFHVARGYKQFSR